MPSSNIGPRLETEPERSSIHKKRGRGCLGCRSGNSRSHGLGRTRRRHCDGRTKHTVARLWRMRNSHQKVDSEVKTQPSEGTSTAVSDESNTLTFVQSEELQSDQGRPKWDSTTWIESNMHPDPFNSAAATGGSDPILINLEDVQGPWPPMPNFIQAPPEHFRQGHVMFLLAEGALTLPSSSLQFALVEAWAEYYYPYMPLVHLHELLNTIHNPNLSGQRVSLLLYQAILFAGAAFVEPAHLDAEPGFSGRREARKELSRRVTLLYDLGYERDRIILIQVALLMSSLSDNPDDHKDSWHWLGMAISMAYAMGMNDQKTVKAQPPREQKLWRRIWWSCYSRDRFLALGLRRPMRIKDEDVTVSKLGLDDFELSVLPDGNKIVRSECTAVRDLNQQLQIADLCVQRSRLCGLIASVLHVQDAYDQTMSTRSTVDSQCEKKLEQDFEAAEEALTEWKKSLSFSSKDRPIEQVEIENGGSTIAVQRSHLHLTYQTILYSLHRPKFLPTSPKLLKSSNKLSRSSSGQQIRGCVVQITRLSKDLNFYGLDNFLPVSGVTTIFPAMVISLLDMKSREESVRAAAIDRFSTCMRAMETLQKTYIAADSTIDYFKMALQRASIKLPSHTVSPTSSSGPNMGENHFIPLSATPDIFVDPSSLGMVNTTAPLLDFSLRSSLFEKEPIENKMNHFEYLHGVQEQEMGREFFSLGQFEDHYSSETPGLKPDSEQELEYLFSGWREFPHSWGTTGVDETIGDISHQTIGV